MKNYEFIGTRSLPTVRLDATNGYILIEGTSIPENIHTFYGPIINWIKEYAKEPNTATKVDIRFKYYNTGTSKCMVEVFKVLEKIHKAGSLVVVTWYYFDKDTDVKEGGGDFAHILDMPFNIISED